MSEILIVDDDVHLGRLIGNILLGAGHLVRFASSAEEALQAYYERPADLILADLVLPDRDGLQLIGELRRDLAEVPVIVMTAGANPDLLTLTTMLGAAQCIIKPFSREDLLTVIDDALLAQLD